MRPEMGKLKGEPVVALKIAEMDGEAAAFADEVALVVETPLDTLDTEEVGEDEVKLVEPEEEDDVTVERVPEADDRDAGFKVLDMRPVLNESDADIVDEDSPVVDVVGKTVVPEAEDDDDTVAVLVEPESAELESGPVEV